MDPWSRWGLVLLIWAVDREQLETPKEIDFRIESGGWNFRMPQASYPRFHRNILTIRRKSEKVHWNFLSIGSYSFLWAGWRFTKLAESLNFFGVVHKWHYAILALFQIPPPPLCFVTFCHHPPKRWCNLCTSNLV